MSERERETAFLRAVISRDRTAESHQVGDEISRLEGQIRVLQRAALWMLVLTALAVVGLGYAVTLSWDYPDNMSRFSQHVGVKVPCALGLASLTSLLFFTGLGIAHRRELDGQREKARQLAEKLLASQLGAGSGASERKAQEEIIEVPIAFRSVNKCG
jgi:hypothetical protein